MTELCARVLLEPAVLISSLAGRGETSRAPKCPSFRRPSSETQFVEQFQACGKGFLLVHFAKMTEGYPRA